MKRIILISAFCLIISNVFSGEITEKEIKTVVNDVTVFLKGAQVTRKKDINLSKGKTLIKFKGLSPFIDAKSVQVKASGDLRVLSVYHQNYSEKQEKTEEIEILESKIQQIDEKIKLEVTFKKILEEELDFLQQNKSLGGKEKGIDIENLEKAMSFYSNKINTIMLKDVEHSKKIEEYQKQKNEISKQITSKKNPKSEPKGEVLIEVETINGGTVSFEISYLVANAGWFPSYDIRAKNINEPIEIIYKANVKQDTKVDWDNVKLKFSSSDPNISGVVPVLKTFFLNYNYIPNRNSTIKSVSGRVYDTKTNEVIPGANIVVEGTTIGTVTDMNGNFSLSIPDNANRLSVSFIGYSNQYIPITSSNVNVGLQQEYTSLDEVVVIGYGTATSSLQGKISGLNLSKNNNQKIRGTSSYLLPTNMVENQTTVDFEIDMPYTIKSDNKSYAVDMAVYNLPAEYEYFSIPKLEKSAFLMANINDWEKYNLLEGEANIFFEDTYIGKTLLDVRYASDTLQISLGRDKSISINREKIKDYTTRKILASKKEENRAWLTTVKNNKNQKINIVILDQVPVSTLEEIEVDVLKLSGGKLNPEIGEVKWELDIKPKEKEELELKYSVKYPKNKTLIIE